MRGHSRILQEAVTGKLEGANVDLEKDWEGMETGEFRKSERNRARPEVRPAPGERNRDREQKKEEEGVSISSRDPINAGAFPDALACAPYQSRWSVETGFKFFLDLQKYKRTTNIDILYSR